MPVSQLPQAPYRQDRRLFPTPLTTDVLFSEIRDCTRTEFPEYGTPHPNAAKWPYHKLIFIKTVDIERDGIFEFFYAADRENQDLYNFASGFRNIIGNVGGREFRVVLREYVTPRADFDPATPEFGSAMPDVPQDTFDGVSYVFFDKQQQKIEQPELDSLYVQETHTYVETAFLDYKLSYLTQVPDLVPDKYRATLPRITTEEIVEGIAVSPTLAANELQASQDQLNPNVKLVKSVTQSKATAVLAGKEIVNQFGGGVASTQESLETSGGSVTGGQFVFADSVTPLGNGQSIRQTLTYDGTSFPVLNGQDYNAELGLDLPFSEQVVAATDPLPVGADVTPIDQWRNKVRTPSISTIQAALDTIHYILPTQQTIQLPNVLKSVSVLASRTTSNGDSYASGTSSSVSCSSSVAVSADLTYELEEGFSGSVPAEIHVFFLSEENIQNTILTKCNASAWPIYQPKSHRVVISGHGLSKNWGFSRSDQGGSSSESSDVQAFTNVGVVPACLHGALPISVSYSDFTSPTTLVDNFIDTAIEQLDAVIRFQRQNAVIGNTVFNVVINTEEDVETVLRIIERNQASNNFRRDLNTGDFRVTVSPSTLAATNPPSLVAGRYIFSSSATLYGYDRVRVTAVVVDLTSIVP